MATKKDTSKNKSVTAQPAKMETQTQEDLKEKQENKISASRIDITLTEETPKKEIPLFVGAKKSVLKQVEKHFGSKTLQSTLKDVATNKRNLGEVLIEAVHSASKIIEAAVKEGDRTAKNELRLNEQYRLRLLARSNDQGKKSTQKSRKNEYVIEGQVLHPTTGAPVPGVTVEAVDKDISKDDLLGVDITDAEGRYRIAFLAKDFKESGEKEAEILLKVGLARNKILAATPLITKMDTGKTATINLTLPESKISTVDKLAADPDSKQTVFSSQSIMMNRLELKALSEIGDTFGKTVDKAAVYLEKRFKKTKGKSKSPANS